MTATEHFVDDLITVQRYRLSPQFPSGGRTEDALIAAITTFDLPPVGALAKAVGHVIFETRWLAKQRPLMRHELAAQFAATRLFNALYPNDRRFQ
jgi:hypothetical protein